MTKSCQQIIQEILTEATENGKTISEKELIKKLDDVEGFWEQAMREDLVERKKKAKVKDL